MEIKFVLACGLFAAAPGAASAAGAKPIYSERKLAALIGFIERLSGASRGPEGPQGDMRVDEALIERFELPRDATSKGITAEAPFAADDTTHIIQVLRPAPNGQPMGLLFATFLDTGKKVDAHYFFAGLDGRLKKIFRSRVELDSGGNPIQSSAARAVTDGASKGERGRYQHELDFWLRAAYRREAAPVSGTMPIHVISP